MSLLGRIFGGRPADPPGTRYIVDLLIGRVLLIT